MSDAHEKDATPAAKTGSSGMMTYIILGVVGLVLAAAAAGGTYFFLAGKSSTAISDSTAADSSAHAHAGNADTSAGHAKDTTHSSSQASSAHGKQQDSIAGSLTEHGSDLKIDKHAAEPDHHTDHADDATLHASGDEIDINSPEFQAEVERNLAALEMAAEDHLEAVDTNAAVAEDSTKAIEWFGDKEQKLAEREKALTQRENEMAALQKKIERQLATIEQAQSARIMNLAKMYDGMDPAAVAKLAENLDDETVVLLLPRMKQKNASLVMAAMPPTRAAKLSEKLITIGE